MDIKYHMEGVKQKAFQEKEEARKTREEAKGSDSPNILLDSYSPALSQNTSCTDLEILGPAGR